MGHSRSLIPLGVGLLTFACKGGLVEPKFPGNNPPGATSALAIGLGGTGTEQVVDLAVDADGSVYVTGNFSGAVDFDPGTGVTSLVSVGLTDGFLAKYSSTGTLAWAGRIGGIGADNVSALARDAGGNLYVVGTFEAASDFDPGPANLFLTSVGGADGFVARYSPTGSLLWARRFGGLAADQMADVAVDGSGNAYAVGTFAGAADALPVSGPQVVSDGSLPDGFLLALDPAGVVRYAFSVGGIQSDAAAGVAVTTDGAVVVAGSFRGAAHFAAGIATTQLTAAGGTDAFLASYTGAGVLLWARAFSGTSDEDVQAGRGLAADASGGVAVSGTFAGTTDFDPGPGSTFRASLGGSDWYVARLDGAGAFRSAYSVGGALADAAPYISFDTGGNLLATGSFRGPVDFDPGTGLRVLSSLATAGSDIFAARYTPTGGVLWVSSFGESTAAGDRLSSGTAIAPGPAGTALVGGRFFGATNFGSVAAPFVLSSLGDSDGFLVKLTSSGTLITNP